MLPPDGRMATLGRRSAVLACLIFHPMSLAAQSAAAAFEYVQQFWEGRDPDAGRLAATALKAAEDARVAAGLTSAEGVSYATREMSETCMTCHAAHREEVSDGTYRIK